MPFPNKKKAIAQRKASSTGFLATLEAATKNFPPGNENIEYRKSKISGIGVFAKVHIRARRIIAFYKGEVLQSKKQLDRREHYYKHPLGLRESYVFQIKGTQQFIDATTIGNAARFINHSCKPNCIAKQYPNTKKISITTLVPVQPGTELTINYGWRNGDKCLCCCIGCKGQM